MRNGSSSVNDIAAVGLLARNLSHRLIDVTPEPDGLGNAVHRLYSLLRHLRIEAEEADSPLNANSSRATAYAHQLSILLTDSQAVLRDVGSFLDAGPADRVSAAHPTSLAWGREPLNALRASLETQTERIAQLLDAVQLQGESSQPAHTIPSDVSEENLDAIKDKVDAIATRLFRRRDSGFSEGDDDIWRQFRAELEREGFSSDVLRKNEEVLRAFIRELESAAGSERDCPSVRGLLEHPPYHNFALAGGSPVDSGSASPKELISPSENEKYLPSMKDARRQPEDQPSPGGVGLAIEPSRSPRDVALRNGALRVNSGPYQDAGNPEFSFVSTLDLLAIPSMTAQFAGLHVSPNSPPQYDVSPSPSPSSNRLFPLVPAGMAVPHGTDFSLGTSPNSYQLGTSPLYSPQVPPLPLPGTSPPPSYNNNITQVPHLAPDRYGNVIPPGAIWTKISRTLVSSEVLHRAGVRYEARPTFVAVLGKLTREDVAEYAKQSAEARAARLRSSRRAPYGSSDSGSTSSDSEDYEDDDSNSGRRRYPVIVDPPSKGAPIVGIMMPKSILKRTRVGTPQGEEISHEDDKRSDTKDRDDRRRRRSSGSNADLDKRDRDRVREKERIRERDRDQDRDRHRERDRNRDRDRDRDRDHRHRRHHRRDRDRDTNRDRDRDRDPQNDRDRPVKRKTWSDALGAAGIGGAAVSLLSVLTEAAL